jgi:4-hydroxy-tetrahydrodipicolinate reductase
LHELIFDAPHEQLILTHRARDRRVFAVGALKAAVWIIGRKGLFGMDDVLESLFETSN